MENFINLSVMGHDFYKYKYQSIRNKTKVKYQKKNKIPKPNYQRNKIPMQNIKEKKVQSQMLKETKAYRWTIMKKQQETKMMMRR